MLHHTNFTFSEQLKERDATSFIVLHHSEVTTPHTAKDVHKWHQKKGWAGIGYHYFIAKDGEIYEGRPHDTVGAHTYGFNAESIGVCFEGDFNKEKMSEKQADASVMLLALLSLAYENISLCTHKELVKEKSCPGKYFPFDKIKDKVEECKNNFKALFGEYKSTIMVNDEWRHIHDNFGDEEEERRRHNAPDIIYIGNFWYEKILNLLKDVEEEKQY